jgi:hypothetical protein
MHPGSYSSAKIGGFSLYGRAERRRGTRKQKKLKIQRVGDEELEKSARLMPDTIDDFEVPLEVLPHIRSMS